jgi:hypothetical protein
VEQPIPSRGTFAVGIDRWACVSEHGTAPLPPFRGRGSIREVNLSIVFHHTEKSNSPTTSRQRAPQHTQQACDWDWRGATATSFAQAVCPRRVVTTFKARRGNRQDASTTFHAEVEQASIPKLALAQPPQERFLSSANYFPGCLDD